MKLSLYLILFGLLPIHATIYSQNVAMNIKVTNLPMRDALKQIEKESGLHFFMSDNLAVMDELVSFDLKNKSFEQVMNVVLQKHGLTYRIFENDLVLITNTSAMEKQGITVTGKITDNLNEPIPGVNITIKGTTQGVTSDIDGKYSIVVPGRNTVLIFSFIGYASQEIVVGDQVGIDLMLLESTHEIEEVVVVGYGTTSKRKMTSSVSSVATEQIENLPSSSVVNSLGGRTPGVIITGSGGGPGNISAVSIRGGGTPLVVIDGVVSEYSDFQNINQNDIENLSILKDASAAAIYGARAGNGILMVTTKRGANKGFSVNYNFSYSLSQPTVLPKKLGSYEKASYINEGYINDGLAPKYSSEVLEKYRTGSDPYNYPNVDWQSLCLDKFAPEMNHNLSLSGGDKKNGYYASFGYYDQGTLHVFNTNWFKRYTARLNIVNNFEKIGLKTTTSVSGAFYNFHYPNSQYGSGYYAIWGHIQSKNPWDLAYNDKGMYANGGDHPLVEMDPRSGYIDNNTKSFNGMFNAEWNVPGVDGFKLKSISNYRMGFYRQKSWMDTAPQAALGSTVPGVKTAPTLSEQYSQSYYFTQQFLADYERKFKNDFTVGLLLGYEFGKAANNWMSASRENYQLNVDQFIAGPTDNLKNDGREYESGRASFIGRLKADYKAKYMVELSFRHDGSDWFPKDNRWGTFWSSSAAWMLTDEAFMENLRDRNILNMFKIRGSYGVLGLDGEMTAGLSDSDKRKLFRYEYVPGYNLDTRAYVIDGKYVQGFSEGVLATQDITWYTSASSDIGFDFASLNSALFGGFTYFYMRTTGYLASPSSAGYTAPLGTNLPKIPTDGANRRAGYEFYLGYKNHAGDFYYEVSGNFTKFDELWENNPYQDENTLKNPNQRNTNETGYNRIGLRSLGYYTSEEDVRNSPHLAGSTNLRPGDIKYEDLDGNGIIDDADKIRIGRSSMPRMTYGINLDLKYKGFFLYALFQGSGKRDFYLGNVVQARDGITYPYQTDYWTPGNTGAMYPRLLSNNYYNGNNNYQDSDFWLVNGAYFRMKAVQVGYDFKKILLNKVPFISNAKLVLSGTNLFTISKTMDYYYDPEGASDGNNYDYPYQRVYSLTLNIGF